MSDVMRTGPELHPEEIAFNQRINAIFLRKDERSFEDVVRDYRQIEAEFVERSRDDEYKVVETKRRVAEWMLNHALHDDQPHEVCRQIWEELNQRGFSNDQQKYSYTGIYARCCQQNGEFDEGIAVLEPLIAEIELRLQDTTLTPNTRAFCEDQLAAKRELRDELKAGIQY